MWFSDLQKAMKWFESSVDVSLTLIKDIKPAYDGIVFHTTDNRTFKWWMETDTMTQLKHWREH